MLEGFSGGFLYNAEFVFVFPRQNRQGFLFLFSALKIFILLFFPSFQFNSLEEVNPPKNFERGGERDTQMHSAFSSRNLPDDHEMAIQSLLCFEPKGDNKRKMNKNGLRNRAQVSC